jgi:hypothetical protein
MRKKADFNIEDRIVTYYQTSGELAKVFADWGETIKSETLAVELHADTPPAGAYVEEHKLDGEIVTIGVERK